MANLNKVMLMGNLTRDPVMKTTATGVSLCELGLAVNRKFRTQQGEDREEVCFVEITFFGRQAETCTRYVRRGDPLYVEGRLRYETWTSKDTQKVHSRLSVIGEGMQFLNRAPAGQNSGGTTPPAAPAPTLPPPPAFTMPENSADGSRQPVPQAGAASLDDIAQADQGAFIENLPF